MSLREEELCEYEQQRLCHIRRNHEFLVSLGLADASVDPVEALQGKKKKPKTTTIRKKKVPVPLESLRRSGRLVGATPAYSHETVTAAADDAFDRAGKREKIEQDDVMDSMREEAMRYLSAVREAQLELGVAAEGTTDEWRDEARRRWGALAGGGENRDWKVFVETRLSRPPPLSPIDFLQEYYCADTWRLLVSCILMSRVSSWKTKHTCISDFFALYPTPTAFAMEQDLRTRTFKAISSLGLFDDRLKGLNTLTDHFLNGAQTADCRADAFDISLDRKSPHKIHGIGEFGYDSWRVFCHDEGAEYTPTKTGRAPLDPFIKWRISHDKVSKSPASVIDPA